MKENSDGNDTNVGSIGNSIEEDIKILESIIKINNDYLKGIENQTINQKEIKAIEHILSDYKRVLKENERYKKSDYETICLENNELREITDRIQSEYKDLLKDNFKLKNELETKRKEYQETYEDIREELGELKKENEELNNRCRNLDKEAQAYLEELAGDNTLTRRTIKQLQEENEECKLDVQDYLKQAQENAEMYRKAQKKIQDLKAENEELKNKLNLKQFDVNIVYNDYLEKLDEYERNTIPIQRIKDIIDRIDYDIKKIKEIISKNTNIYASYRKNDYQIVRLKAMNTKSLDIKKRLQELLDGSDTDVGSIESEE